MNKPFKSYNGGKESDGTFQKIISIFPPHDIYIEPFLGNGAILRHKKPATTADIGIDIDTGVTEKWKVLPGSNVINADGILWLENFQILASILKNIGLSILIYLDPPYPKDVRKNQKDLYRYELSEDDHNRILDVAGSLDANIIISSYPNKNYDWRLREWNSFTFQSQTRSGTATEKVWYNFETPKILHDYRYIGRDYRERERIKGIICRNVSKIKRMPAVERNALIHKLKENGII